MDRTVANYLLQAMIDFFEAGNKQTDSVAKAIIESDFDYLDRWKIEIKRLKDEGEWSGLRAPEADIVIAALRAIQELIEEKS
ncbi:MAG: hypothetical protein JRF02_02505 [Deltaproteobacteria bacterium]|jgi:hypothetical protein|nr:hypothetical protein [Deltaproteobacteria bacterium]